MRFFFYNNYITKKIISLFFIFFIHYLCLSQIIEGIHFGNYLCIENKKEIKISIHPNGDIVIANHLYKFTFSNSNDTLLVYSFGNQVGNLYLIDSLVYYNQKRLYLIKSINPNGDVLEKHNLFYNKKLNSVCKMGTSYFYYCEKKCYEEQIDFFGDVKHGKYKLYIDGKLVVSGRYNYGLKHGLWREKSYFINSKIRYKNGIVVKTYFSRKINPINRRELMYE